MVFETIIATVVAILLILLTNVLTRFWERLAGRFGIYDTPNNRSSHESTTPRAGGIVILVVMLLISLILLLYFTSYLLIGFFWLFCIVIAGIIGFYDDVHNLSAKVRMLLYSSLVIFFLILFPEKLQISALPFSILPKVLQIIFMFLFLLWVLNLYNFMDGINGIAGGQLISIGIPLFVIAFVAKDYFVSLALMIFIIPTFGFLTRNWKSRANVFLGDVGSVMIGFFIGTLGLIGETHGSISLPTWLILMGVFVVDSTFTLIRRVVSGQNPFKPHKSHAYQLAQQKYGSHLIISASVVLINLVWLFPIAAVNVYVHPLPEWTMLIIAWFPLVTLAFILKAGKQ